LSITNNSFNRFLYVDVTYTVQLCMYTTRLLYVRLRSCRGFIRSRIIVVTIKTIMSLRYEYETSTTRLRQITKRQRCDYHLTT